MKKNKTEWKFAKKREELIKMVGKFRDKTSPPCFTAEDIVDCILVQAWEYKEREVKA